ncbi:MAG: VWA domain-containing protein [Phycisphaerales bacterium]|nr:VWA domain-containing protein [Phycisphaerales bacterium]
MTDPSGTQPTGRPRARPDGVGSGVAAVAEAAPFDEKLLRWIRRATVIGLAVSVLVHLAAWFIAAHMSIGLSAGAGPAPMPGVVDFAVMTEAELSQLQDSALSFDSPSVPETNQEPLPEIESLDMPSEEEITGSLAEIAPTTIGAGAGDIGQTSGLSEGGSGSGSASFFGVEATGSRFLYIVDTSGSMGIGGKLEALQHELVKSLDGLLEAAEFLVITYNSGASALDGRQVWSDADERGRRAARRAIARLGASGGTNPGPAFQLGFAMRPPPDAIYFMTDGEFSDEVAGEIAMLNAEYKVPIHCIAFVSRESEILMRTIAQQSGGSYTFVPAPTGRP